jgi:hypothetical protein
MLAERGRGRYFVAAILLVLQAPVLIALAIGAVLTRAVLALSQAAHLVAGSLGRPARGRTP